MLIHQSFSFKLDFNCSQKFRQQTDRTCCIILYTVTSGNDRFMTDIIKRRWNVSDCKLWVCLSWYPNCNARMHRSNGGAMSINYNYQLYRVQSAPALTWGPQAIMFINIWTDSAEWQAERRPATPAHDGSRRDWGIRRTLHLGNQLLSYHRSIIGLVSTLHSLIFRL